MDPAVQVAIVSVIATCVTTAGVVAVAIINKRGNEDQDNPDGDLDVTDVLNKLVSMAAEIQRKEASIQRLKTQIDSNRRRIVFLETLIDQHSKETEHERDHGRARSPSEEPDLE